MNDEVFRVITLWNICVQYKMYKNIFEFFRNKLTISNQHILTYVQLRTQYMLQLRKYFLHRQCHHVADNLQMISPSCLQLFHMNYFLFRISTRTKRFFFSIEEKLHKVSFNFMQNKILKKMLSQDILKITLFVSKRG